MNKISKHKVITLEMAEAAEAQIIEQHRIIDYDTREYPVEVLVDKYLKRIDEDDNDFFIPDYQREHTWTELQQSKFIESVLMGLPIPLLFVADIKGKDGRAEIVDGSQRIRTLASFYSNKLCLSGLKKLDKLNGFTFNDLPLSRQRRFGRHTVRMIELREGTDEESRRDIFSRINTGNLKLNDMEIRWGVNDGPFLDFIKTNSQHKLFLKLAPFSEKAIKLKEPQEYVLRFFAYLNNHDEFRHSVVDFLDKYLKETQLNFNEEVKKSYQEEWDNMLSFVNRHFPHGFAKKKGHVKVPRIRYESIAVGAALALRENPHLEPKSISWIDSEEFKKMTRSDGSNSRPKLIERINFVKNHFLKG